MRETDFNLHWSSTHYSGGHYHIKTVSAKNWITRNASPEKSWLLLLVKEELNMTPVEMTPDDSWAVWCHDDGGGMWSYDRAVMLCPPPSVTPVASQPCDTQVAELTSAEWRHRAMRYPGDNTSISSPITDPITKQLPEKIWHPGCGMCGLYLSIVYLAPGSSAGWELCGGGGVDTYTYSSFASDWDILSLVSDSLNMAGTLNITTTPLS